MKINLLFLLITNTAVSQFPGVKSIGLPDPCSKIDCLYEGNFYDEGSVIYCSCIELICTANGWVESGISKTCCMYDGEYYENGSILKWGCFLMKCTDGSWLWDSIKEECETCYVSNDPNIFTFDKHRYSWNGKCNYTLTQPFHCEGCESYFPPYAVYGQFAPCVGRVATCVYITTYKVDPNTAVEINHLTMSVTINGNSVTLPLSPIMPTDPNGYPYPVFAWYDGSAVYIIGLQYSIIAYRTDLFIYALTETSIYGVAGLCGFFSNDPVDDFLTRDCNTLNISDPSDIKPFAESWMTLEMDFNCLCEKEAFPVRRCEQYRQICEDIIYGALRICFPPSNEVINFAIESCISDSCLEPDFAAFWQEQARQFVCSAGELRRRQNGGLSDTGDVKG